MAEATTQKQPGAIRKFFTVIGNFIHGVWVMIRGMLVLLGISMLMFIIGIGLIISRAEHHDAKKALPAQFVISYDFAHDIAEAEEGSSFSRSFLDSRTMLADLIDAIDSAAKDTRVKGFAARLDGLSLSVAQVQELRAAIGRFRASGKPTYIYADSYGDMSPGMSDYYFASSFGQVWMQPVGFVGLTGVAMETPFLRGLFDLVGVEPQFAHKGIYKSAPESLTEREFTAPSRESITSLITDLSHQMTEGIAESRKLTPEQVRGLIDNAPYTDAQALAAKLVDHVGYYDEMVKAVLKESGMPENADTVELADFTDDIEENKGILAQIKEAAQKEIDAREKLKAASQEKDKPVIAVIRGVGEITPGSATHPPEGFEATGIVDAFNSAADDENVSAIIFRVDSPGGSPIASESILRAMNTAQAKGKPVIVSMGGYAASGGYWVSSGADKIVAEPGTITGSIGVFGGKFVLKGLWDKLGVNWENIGAGNHAGMWSFNRSFTEEEFKKFDGTLAAIYDAFIARVAKGRKLTPEQVEAVAEGRVWTGRQAKDRGLVDELGGFDKAVEMAKTAAKLDAKADIDLEEYPAPKTPFEKLMEMAQKGAFFRPKIDIKAADIRDVLQQMMQDQRTLAPVGDIR